MASHVPFLYLYFLYLMSLMVLCAYPLEKEIDNTGQLHASYIPKESLVQESNKNIESLAVAKISSRSSTGNMKKICKKGSRQTSSLLNHLIFPSKHYEMKDENNVSRPVGNKSVGPLWLCKPFPIAPQSVVILNNKTCLADWLEKINKTTGCAVVLFYAKWCYFSATLAPLYNAVGRAFHGLPVLALDAYTHNSFNNRYGIVGVPTIMLFHESRPVSRFNRSRTLKDLVDFIYENTGMKYNTSVELTAEDYLSPLPSTPSEEPNYYLLASLLFVLSVLLVLLWRLGYIQPFYDHLPSWTVLTRLFARHNKQE